MCHGPVNPLQTLIVLNMKLMSLIRRRLACPTALPLQEWWWKQWSQRSLLQKCLKNSHLTSEGWRSICCTGTLRKFLRKEFSFGEESCIYCRQAIGTSLALGIKGTNVTVLGFNRSEASRTIALERGMVDQWRMISHPLLADIIILALPIKPNQILPRNLSELWERPGTGDRCRALLKRNCHTSWKKVFTDKAVRFVGGLYPMAGSHKDRCRSSRCCLIWKMPIIFYSFSRRQEVPSEEVERASEWLGSRFVEIDAEHDRVTFQISHFPHILASTLVRQLYGEKKHGKWPPFCGWWLSDMTRIAESEPGMWTYSLVQPSSDRGADCEISKSGGSGWDHSSE